MNTFLKSSGHYGDIVAIPFFLLLTVYMNNIPDKTDTEWLLFIFGIGGLILDILFTWIWIMIK